MDPDAAMVDQPEKPAQPVSSPEDKAKAERAKRLASALRDNLRRRKAPSASAKADQSN
jgi:hypothetical protein